MTDDILVVALAACSSRKLPHVAPARDLYQGQLFKAVRAYVEAKGWPWHILSARYGLVDPDEVLEPYDHVLGDAAAWTAGVWQALLRRYSPDRATRFCFFAGKRYRLRLMTLIHASPPWQACAPLAGYGYAQQVAWLRNGLIVHNKKAPPRPTIS